jgi:hypothetical protein
MVGRRGGIHVVFAIPLASVLPGGASDAPALKAAAIPSLRLSAQAAVVEENTVDVPRGQALSLGAFGPVSVVANRLISRGLVAEDLLALMQAGAGWNVLLHLSSLVAIVNLGSTGGGPVNMGAATGGLSTSSASAAVAVASGKVLFDDNQCVLDLVNGPKGPGPTLPGGALWPAVLVLSLDDVGFADNQCDCLIGEGAMPVANLLLGLWTERVVANRFTETLGKAQFSAFTFAIMNMTVNNQANHCLRTIGPLRLQAQPNHVLISAFLKDYCTNAERQLVTVVRAFQ